jgi:TonB family protein
MTYSVTCIEQRQKEAEKTRKLVTVGVVGSIAFHSIMFAVLNSVEKPLTEENKPIEFIVVQEPEIKPKEKPVTKTEIKPQPQQKLETVKPPLPQLKEVKPQPTVTKTEITPPSPITPVAKINPTPQPQPQKTPEVIENNPQSITPSPSPNITPSPSPNITPSPQPSITQPQEVLTSNTLARNNAPRAVKPIENNSNNSFSNSFNSSTRVENNNNNQTSTVAGVSGDMPISSGRLSRNNSKTPTAVNNNQGEGVGNLRNSLSRGNTSTSNNNSKNTVSGIPSNIAATSQSVPQRPQAKPTPPPPESIKCIRNCDPSYPFELQGVEGKATVKVNLDSSGNVLGVSVVNPHSNGEVNRQALLAARQMGFSSPTVNNASVQVSINFTVAGSEFDRLARQKKEEVQRQARLSQEKERQERQAQLEKERLQRQQQLEKERQEREAQARIEKEKRETELKRQQELEIKPTETLPSEIPSINPVESVDN